MILNMKSVFHDVFWKQWFAYNLTFKPVTIEVRNMVFSEIGEQAIASHGGFPEISRVQHRLDSRYYNPIRDAIKLLL